VILIVELVTMLFSGIPVRDYERAAEWYERLLGRPPDMLPKEGEAVWKLAESAWIYVVRDPGRAGNALLTLMVDELPPVGTEIVEMGGMPTVSVLDPEGNKITFGQPNS
jgi:catechol 2,3-dioxygenase-like lactoylglutathione lyase family enzyme